MQNIDRARRGKDFLDDEISRFESKYSQTSNQSTSNPGQKFNDDHKIANLKVNPLTEDWDALAAPPEVCPKMFKGIIGRIATTASRESEVNPVAAAAATLSWLSVSFGRNPAIRIGDNIHALHLFTLHVGRSSRGGKGMALGLLEKVQSYINEIDPDIAPQVHSGGLSTREGLALLIHDGYQHGRHKESAIRDKRLFIIETEFSNVLNQSKRHGNTLSACIRDLWDSRDIKPATKTFRICASNPHIGLHGCITPTELRSNLSSGDLTNGFANRLLIFWAERKGSIAFPQSADEEEISSLARDLISIITSGKSGYPELQDRDFITFSSQAKKYYEEIYHSFSKPHAGGELISGLLQRRAPMLLRIAGIFALCDYSREIKLSDVESAYSWIEYYSNSVAMIFGPNTNQYAELKIKLQADQLLSWLSKSTEWTSRSSIARICFGANLPKKTIDCILERLLIENRIVRRIVNTGGPTPRTEYKLRT